MKRSTRGDSCLFVAGVGGRRDREGVEPLQLEMSVWGRESQLFNPDGTLTIRIKEQLIKRGGRA